MTQDPLTFGNLFGIDPDYKNAPSDYERGQRDMLAKCIAAVRAEFARSLEPPYVDEVVDVLLALLEKP
jgi:hypothetical protein